MPQPESDLRRNETARAEVAGDGRETARLRLFFLGPLTLILAATVVGIDVGLYLRERADLQQGVVHLRTSAIELYEDSVRDSARALRTLAGVLGQDAVLRTALARRDRAALLARAAPLFESMKREYGVTHLYFSRPDRVNLLRVHEPARHGDVIDRVTTRLAERDGVAVHGVELGPLGTFTLRLVVPWFEENTRRPLGYVELGMEIDQVLARVRGVLGVELFVLIDKRFLNRAAWEEGMHVLGRTADWDRFPEVVLSAHGGQVVPPALVARFATRPFDLGYTTVDALPGDDPHRAIFSSLRDAAGRDVARLVVLVDVSRQLDSARYAVLVGGAATLVSGAALFAFFWWLVGRVGRRIERDERTLRDLAARDQLTGAFNRRSFDELLPREMARARRYKTPLALVMFDIDHFKKVNDTHGHPAGDDLLFALTTFVGANVRDSDILARWGGEEFMLIAPNADAEAGRRLAEKLRALIEHGDFGAIGRVTCSFGVTQLEPDDTPESFVARADESLYRAKQGGRNRVETTTRRA